MVGSDYKQRAAPTNACCGLFHAAAYGWWG